MKAKTLGIAMLLCSCTPTPAPTGLLLSATRVICDKAHTTFDVQGNTYCQEIPQGIRAYPISPAPQRATAR